MSDADAHQVRVLVQRIKPILAGHEGSVQGGVLADLLAIWLAGHRDRSSDTGTEAFREEMLALHIATVRDLIKINHKIIRGGNA